MDETEKQISLYSSLAVALLLSSGKLLALREGALLAKFWRFDAAELCFQVILIFLFCYSFFALNLTANPISALRLHRKHFRYIAFNGLIFFVFVVLSAISLRILFYSDHVPPFFRAIHFSRFALALIFTGFMIKVMILMREAKRQARENEQLKSSYMKAELELLKDQLNPHFLFNALSSLSSVVRENPVLAQQYIMHLSKVFRYTLEQPVNNLVSLKDELKMIESFAHLLKMRFEDSFNLEISVDSQFFHYKLPHLSLQPLLENAAKHNAATVGHPLLVRLFIQDDQLVISNNRNPVKTVSGGLGLLNLNERYKILMHHEITVERNPDFFSVKLPLLYE